MEFTTPEKKTIKPTIIPNAPVKLSIPTSYTLLVNNMLVNNMLVNNNDPKSKRRLFN